MIKLEYMFNTIAFMWIEILIDFCMAEHFQVLVNVFMF